MLSNYHILTTSCALLLVNVNSHKIAVRYSHFDAESILEIPTLISSVDLNADLTQKGFILRRYKIGPNCR